MTISTASAAIPPRIRLFLPQFPTLTKLSTPSWDSNANFGGHFILIHPDTRTVHSKSAKGTPPRSGLPGPPSVPRVPERQLPGGDGEIADSKPRKWVWAIPRSMPRKSLNAPQLFLGAQLRNRSNTCSIRSSRVSPVFRGHSTWSGEGLFI